jgi:hypothetical protein
VCDGARSRSRRHFAAFAGGSTQRRSIATWRKPVGRAEPASRLLRTGAVTRALIVVVLCACNRALAPGAALEGTTSDAALAPEVEASDGPERVEPDAFVLRGAEIVGLGRVDVEIRGGRIAALGEVDGDGLREVDARGRFVVPAFVDSHVHLAYAFDAPTLAAGGVAAAVDLGAPIDFLGADHAPLRVIAAGPMITAIDGYPTQSWGANGYGLEIDGVAAARGAVDRLVEAGARVIKVPVGGQPALDDDELRAVVERAHALGVRVAAHALGDEDARRAANAGADVLAHTPIEPLSRATVDAWGDRAVVSTLAAFGGSAEAIDNLRRLRAAGATVLYGTDLGNSSIPAIDPNEIAALVAAGLDGADVLAAGTSTPAAYWGFEGLGALREGAPASFLVLAADPGAEPAVLARPETVWIDGRLL